MRELSDLEAMASTACQDRDLILGLVLSCIKHRRLFLAAGYQSLWEYLVRRQHVFAFGRRLSERLLRGYAVLKLLRAHPVRPTRERQVVLCAAWPERVPCNSLGDCACGSRVQVRELAGASAQAVLAAWQQAVALAAARGCEVTAAVVHEVLDQSKGPACGQQPIHLSSRSCQWHSPPSLLSLVTELFRGQAVDLDPCSDSQAQQRVQAKRYYCAAEDGLSQPWKGRIFVNPPFGVQGGHSLSGAFFQKAVQEYEQGNAAEVLLVLKAAIGYAWFPPVLQWPHVWLHRRIAFLLEGGDACMQNPHGSIAVYLGREPAHFC